MSKGLDAFFSTGAKPKPTVEERCANPRCRKIIKSPTMKFQITRKGETKTYCQQCYKAIMRPQEDSDANI